MTTLIERYQPNVSLVRAIPPVLRAREFRLYLADGRRIVDLWQCGGAAILGHTPPAVTRELKNNAERGLYTPFPHGMEQRFLKALSRLFAGKALRIYGDANAVRRALNAAGFPDTTPIRDAAFLDDADSPRTLAQPVPPDAMPIRDAALPDDADSPRTLGRPVPPDATPIRDAALPDDADSPRTLALWRPFLPKLRVDTLLPVLPCPLAPHVVVFDEGAAFPPSDIIAPVLLAPATRAIYDLLASPDRAERRFTKLEHALVRGAWRQCGPYCSLETPLAERDYAALFQHFFDNGFLLPPSQRDPLILPPTLSAGEEAKLASLLTPLA
jgi:hypothetical protein